MHQWWSLGESRSPSFIDFLSIDDQVLQIGNFFNPWFRPWSSMWSHWETIETTRTNLTGDESLEADDVGWGLDGAENIGQEGERGEVGLGDVVLKDNDKSLIPTAAGPYALRHESLRSEARLNSKHQPTCLVCSCDSLGSTWKQRDEIMTKMNPS